MARNILLTSLSAADDILPMRYFALQKEFGYDYCDALLDAEAGIKAVLARHDIDEVIVIGGAGAYDKEDDMKPAFLTSGSTSYPGDKTSLSAYGKLLQDTRRLLLGAIHAFRIISSAYLFTGMAIFSSAFFTALNNGQVSALISFLRTFVFELGAVLLLPVLFGVDGIWFSVVFAELMAAIAGSIFMAVLSRKYLYIMRHCPES